MFENYSREQIGRIAILITTLFAIFGTELEVDAITTTILTIINIVNALGYIYRLQKGDVSLGARRV